MLFAQLTSRYISNYPTILPKPFDVNRLKRYLESSDSGFKAQWNHIFINDNNKLGHAKSKL